MRLLLLSTALSASLMSAASVSFEKDIQPIFAAKCLACHGATPMGKLDLRTPEAALKGSATGAVIQPGNAAKSLLLDKIVTRQMPPGKVKMTDAEIDIVRRWIDTSLAPPPPDVEPVPTERDVLAILQVRCMICHGSLKQQGGLDLRTVASRIKGGKSGTALVPGKPEESRLYTRMLKGEMPPAAGAKELAVELPTDAETEKVKRWIAAGAPGPSPTPAASADIVVKDKDKQFWSFQPPVRPAVPQPKHAALVRNPIDAFLLVKLEEKNLSYANEASKLSLLRRVALDLTGLPPTKSEIDEYLKDTAPGAYERVVDRLLASQHFGERWGQHWLDLAGYADSEGFGQDDGVRPYAWRYRDYVIRSLNADKPYDKFITEQLAGDELSDDWKKAKGTASQEVVDRLAATGFLRATPDQTNSEERALIAERMNIVSDELEVLSSSLMGLTVGCARCHNHKYDPIPQRDYYRMSAILQAAYNPYEWKTPKNREIDLALESERKAADEANAPVQAELKRVQDEIKKLVDGYRKDGDKSSARELEKSNPELAEALKPLREEQGKLRGKLVPKPHVRVLTDNAEPSVSYLLRRGDPVSFGDPVDAGVPTLLENPALKPYQVQPPFEGASGRRLALAAWLTQPNHPLTARVAVNQIWSRHFGRGIVPTVANFGRSGMGPANQELLDWLATEFVAKGWSMKQVHRLIVTSQAYRQTSKVDSATLAADPENVLVSRMPLQRMDAETLYDALLTTTGRLDPTMFGKPADIEIKADKEVVMKPAKEGFRRAIYVLHRRQTPLSLMDAFDQPAMTPNCTERRRSNVATQALHMMNGSMTWDLSRFMAGRVIDEAGGDRAKQIEQVYLRAYSRAPSASEIAIGKAAIEEFARQWPARLATDNSETPHAASAQWLALANYCHAILNSAEFSFID
jgi:mono/diheme cytochrome c family protein